MKRIILCLLLSLSVGASFAQTSGGPDPFGYIWRNSNDSLGPVYSWIDITTKPGAQQILGFGDDDSKGPFPIGFQFPYYWYEVSQFWAGSNGYIIFQNGQIASPFPLIPNTAQPQDFIGAFMSDLTFIGAGNIAECWYWSNLTDTMIISYLNAPFWQQTQPTWTGANTFQIILSKTDSSITFQYDIQQGSSAAIADFISIGIENNSGAIGLEQVHDVYPSQQYAIKFHYPQSSSFVVNDAGITYNNNPETGGIFLNKDGATFTMSTQVKNTGNQPLDSIMVVMQIVNSVGFNEVEDTLYTGPLAPGATQDLVSADIWYPVNIGTYQFVSATVLPGDATPTNDLKSLEMVVVDSTQNVISLSYTEAVAPTGSVSWSGGDAGAGVEFVPPFYPCYVVSVEYLIVDDPNFVGYHSLVYNRTGSATAPGTLLDSTFIDPTQTLVGVWNFVDLPVSQRIDSGSVYVGWLMAGEGVSLGTEGALPISNRTYEVLGAWSIYRDRETADQMIRLNISATDHTGIKPVLTQDVVGEFYPVPSRNKVYISTEFLKNNGEMRFEFFNLNGALIESKTISQNGTNRQVHAFDISDRSPGIYFCKITSGGNEYNRKLVISK